MNPRRDSKAKVDVYFDTVTLSNFALSGRLDLLVDRYGRRSRVTEAVRDEVLEGVVAGYRDLMVVEEALEDGRLGSAASLAGAERGIYGELLRFLAPGDASCIACAKIRGGVVATDDRAARDACSDRDVLVTGTIGILKACARDGALTLDAADAVLQSMIDAGYFSPVRRISDLR